MNYIKIQKTFKNSKPTIFLMPTPIGNLNDITKNFIDTIENISVLYCEDTRTTKILLDKINKKIKTKSFHKFNESMMSHDLIEILNSGLNIGICSDAGMPGICDPGMHVINKIINQDDNFNLTIISPGSAFLGSLLISGLYEDEFKFIGFLPKKENQINVLIKDNMTKTKCLVFYESVHRILKTIDLLSAIIDDDCEISIVRELTKINEEIIRGTIYEVNKFLKTQKFVEKGEFCVVIKFESKSLLIDDLKTLEEAQKNLSNLIKIGIKPSDAIKKTSKIYNVNKNKLYKFFIDKKGN